MSNSDYIDSTISTLKKDAKDASIALANLEEKYKSQITDYLDSKYNELEKTQDAIDQAKKVLADLKTSFDACFDQKVDSKRAQYKASMDANRIYKK